MNVDPRLQFHHIGVTVENLSASAEMIGQILDGTVVFEDTLSGPALGSVLAIDSPELYVKIIDADGTLVELLQFDSQHERPAALSTERVHPASVGAVHVCFDAPDIQRAHETLTAAGGTALSDPHDVDGTELFFAWQNGVLVEVAAT